MKKKIIRVSTIPMSLEVLLKGQLKFLNKFYKIIAVSGEGKSLRKVENREGVDVFPITMKRSISPIKDFISLWRLYLFFKREKPIIVHSITPKAGLLSMIAAYFAKVPIRIHTFTGLIFPYKSGFLKVVLIFMDKVLCKCATKIYPEGEGVKKDLLKYNITNKHLKVLKHVCVNGVDIDHFKRSNFSIDDNLNLKNNLNISKDDIVFLFVGRLVGDKGINELVATFEKLQKQISIDNLKLEGEFENIKLLLVGSFETKLDPLKTKTIDIINLNKNIISVGYKNDVRPYYAISDIFVLPTYREGFPNGPMQAGAMELPCIVTNISGCNEIIINEENGWIIPPKDENAIFEAMEYCLLNKEKVVNGSKNSRAMITERYEQKALWKEMLDEYKFLENKYKN